MAISRFKYFLINKYNFPLVLLMGFALYFSRDIYSLKKFLAQADISSHYFPYRHWFTSRLMDGEFPQWNPYWGLGKEAQLWSRTLPIDIFTPLEFLVGPQYHYFQALLLVLALAVVFYIFLKLEFSPIVAATGAIFYLMSPMVSYFYFYFFPIFSFMGNALFFLLAFFWFKTRECKYLYLIAVTAFLTMFGTTMEFWFYNKTIFVVYVLICAFLFYSKDIIQTLKMIFLPYLFLGMGILCHTWQLNTIIRSLSYSPRGGGQGISNIFNEALYRHLSLSLLESPFLAMFLAGVLFYLALNSKGKKARKFALSGALVATISSGLIYSALTLNIINPVFLGALFGLFVSWFVLGVRTWRPHVKSFIIFLLFIYYWCRVQPGDVGEMSELNRAPAVLIGCFSFLFWLGCSEVRKSRLAQLAYLSAIFVFMMRDQGQILLAYLSGMHWVPTRDNYIIDFCLIVIAVFGLRNLLEGPSWLKDKSFLAWNYSIPVTMLGVIVLLSGNLYFSHWMMTESPPDYPYFKGIPEVRRAIRDLKDTTTTRVLLVNKPTTSLTFGFGESLLEGVNQITHYTSAVPKNYQKWALYKRSGIKPDVNLSIYDPRYTKRTLSRLPKKKSLGIDLGKIYFYILIARPPLELNALKFLGINYVVLFNKSLEDSSIGNFDLEGVDFTQIPKDLELRDLHESKGGYYLHSNDIIIKGQTNYEEEVLTIGRVTGALPRAYMVSGVSEDSMEEFRSELDVKIIDPNVIQTKKYSFNYTPATIESYENEYVRVDANGDEGSYLVLGDLNHPFWHAKLDGEEIEIVPAFYIMRGVMVPPGDHIVEFYLDIPLLKVSILFSVAVFILLLVSIRLRTLIDSWLVVSEPN